MPFTAVVAPPSVVREDAGGVYFKFALSGQTNGLGYTHEKIVNGVVTERGVSSNVPPNSAGFVFHPIFLEDDSRSQDVTYKLVFSGNGAPSQTYTITVSDNDAGTLGTNGNVSSAYQNIMRVQTVPQSVQDQYSLFNIYKLPLDQVNLDATFYTTRERIAYVDGFAKSTTSVAVAAYEFFTGKIPSLAGIDYLVSPTGGNANNLNSGYYAAFNLENRYINFAANLGLVGEGAGGFAAAYKDLAWAQAVDVIYDKVIGKAAAQAAGIDVSAALANIAGRSAYFDAVASERLPTFDHDLAMKAGLAGYIMAEAIKADVGVYSHALANFYLDFSDAKAMFGASLIGSYGAGTPFDLI